MPGNDTFHLLGQGGSVSLARVSLLRWFYDEQASGSPVHYVAEGRRKWDTTERIQVDGSGDGDDDDW